MIKEHGSSSEHNFLRNGIDSSVHLDFVSIDFDQKDSEVGSSKIQGQEFSSLCNRKLNFSTILNGRQPKGGGSVDNGWSIRVCDLG